jgi:quercetin dioxygenase-like cupin family protein
MMDRNDGSQSGLQYTNAVNGQAANQFDWGSIQWLCSNELCQGADITFGYVQIEPGKKNPRHYHPNSGEVLFLIEGELDHTIGAEVFHLAAGMSIFIPQNAEHDARNPGSQTARMVVTYPTGDRQAVMLEEGED